METKRKEDVILPILIFVLVLASMTVFSMLYFVPKADGLWVTETKTPTRTATETTAPSKTPTATRTPRPTPTATVIPWRDVPVPWTVYCEEGDSRPQDGYIDRGICVPGVISKETWYKETTVVVVGNLSSYDPGIMAATAAWRGLSLDDYEGGMSAISCGDLGKPAWINFPPDYEEWIGPFLVVDCSGRNHMFVTAGVYEISGELAYKDARRIIPGDALTIQDVAFRYGPIGYGDPSTWIRYSDWFMWTLSFDWRP